jgi:hypothetical protein
VTAAARARPLGARRLEVRSAEPLGTVALRRDALRVARSAREVVGVRVLALLPALREAGRTAARALPADVAGLADIAAATAVERVVAGEHLAAVGVLMVAVGGELVARDRALRSGEDGWLGHSLPHEPQLPMSRLVSVLQNRPPGQLAQGAGQSVETQTASGDGLLGLAPKNAGSDGMSDVTERAHEACNVSVTAAVAKSVAARSRAVMGGEERREDGLACARGAPLEVSAMFG